MWPAAVGCAVRERSRGWRVGGEDRIVQEDGSGHRRCSAGLWRSGEHYALANGGARYAMSRPCVRFGRAPWDTYGKAKLSDLVTRRAGVATEAGKGKLTVRDVPSALVYKSRRLINYADRCGTCHLMDELWPRLVVLWPTSLEVDQGPSHIGTDGGVGDGTQESK